MKFYIIKRFCTTDNEWNTTIEADFDESQDAKQYLINTIKHYLDGANVTNIVANLEDCKPSVTIEFTQLLPEDNGTQLYATSKVEYILVTYNK